MWERYPVWSCRDTVYPPFSSHFSRNMITNGKAAKSPSKLTSWKKYFLIVTVVIYFQKKPQDFRRITCYYTTVKISEASTLAKIDLILPIHICMYSYTYHSFLYTKIAIPLYLLLYGILSPIYRNESSKIENPFCWPWYDDCTLKHILSHFTARYEQYNKQYINHRYGLYICIYC